jgi:hypothetical protein
MYLRYICALPTRGQTAGFAVLALRWRGCTYRKNVPLTSDIFLDLTKPRASGNYSFINAAVLVLVGCCGAIAVRASEQ